MMRNINTKAKINSNKTPRSFFKSLNYPIFKKEKKFELNVYTSFNIFFIIYPFKKLSRKLINFLDEIKLSNKMSFEFF